MSTTESRFLRLPLEIRLQIYDLCLISGSLTISGCLVPPWWPDSINSGNSIPGLVRKRMPVAREGFDRDLLEGHPDIKKITWAASNSTTRSESPYSSEKSADPSSSTLTSTPQIHAATPFNDNPAWMLPAPCSPSRESPSLLYPTLPSLRLTCRKIRSELESLRNLHSVDGSQKYRKLDLYLSYPDGVCTVAHRYPHLVDQARAVYIAGLCYLVGVKSPLRPEGVRRFRWKGGIGCRISKLSPEEEQADALADLIDHVNLVGLKSIQAGRRAMDHTNEHVQEPINNPSIDEHSESPKSTSPSASASSTDSSSPLDQETHETKPKATQVPTIDPPPTPENTHRKITQPSLFLRIFYSSPRRTRAGFDDPSSPPMLSPLATAHYNISSHTLSPITIALNSIYGGIVNLSISRSESGSGVQIVATGNEGRRREVRRVVAPGETDFGFVRGRDLTEDEMWDWVIPRTWGVEGSSDESITS